ncbi:H/ACA ribonucleoprotein complex non-core subunit NAF1-like [Asparagus officinalis]|nr:H/ACA ribonucleoprotein complex non-core subunit NAF1-like [Asparagus officinalis]
MVQHHHHHHHQQQQEWLDDSYFVDFDPIKEWLVDPADFSPMYNSLDNILKDHILEPSIDVKMEKVSLVEVNNDGVSEEICPTTDPIKVATDCDLKEESSAGEEEDDSSSDGSSSSSSSSSSDDESSSSDEEGDEGKGVTAVEVEEGEIKVDEVILGSDGEEEVPRGPIKSKHEIEDLPPVPPLEVSLEPHHQTLPVGVVSSILSSRVIVEGSEKHNPLNEGSILWITETRLPLGRIDEIFGPVKNPFYIVRYNSDDEVPQGISTGVAISFVVDFANHILNEKCLYEKGYDASGIDDEEATDEVEFSDDEKEAEYKRSLRQSKRDANYGKQETGLGKKANYKGSGFQRGQHLQPPQSLPVARMSQQLAGQEGQVHVSLNSEGYNNCNYDHRAAGNILHTPQQLNTQGFLLQPQSIGFPAQAQPPIGVQGGFPQPHSVQFPAQAQPSMGIQGGFPQPQLIAIQGGLPMNLLPSQQFGDQTYNLQNQNQVFNNFASGIMPYQHLQQQQLVSRAGVLPGNFQWFDGLSSSSTLAGIIGQSGFSHVPFGYGNLNPSQEQSHGLPPPAFNQQADIRCASLQFNQGRSSASSRGRGRRAYPRGGRQSFAHQGGNQHNG